MIRTRFALNRIIQPKLSLEDFFKLTKDLDLNKIELRNDLPGGKIIDDYTIENFNALSKKYGVEIIAINALQQFNLSDILSEKKTELREMITLAASINCKAIVLCPNNAFSFQKNEREVFRETLASLKAFGPLLQESGIQGLIEPLGFTECSLRSQLRAQKAIQESGFSSYKIVHDTFHHFIGPDTIETIINDYDVSYIGLVHVCGIECEMSLQQYKDKHRILVNEKDRLQTKAQLEILLKLGYRGNISFEPFSKSIQEMEIESLKSSIDSSIELLSE